MTQIEHDAWWGWHHFRTRMEEIWKVYSIYGEIVLEKDLEEDDAKFKPLFEQANGNKDEFLKIIRKFWEDNYHFVASDFKGLINILDHYRKKNGSCALDLLPESGSYSDGETKGCDKTYSITEEFYKQLAKQAEGKVGERVLLVNYDAKKIIEIEFEQTHSYNTYNTLLVKECSKIIKL